MSPTPTMITQTVPITDPAHPHHSTWLTALLAVLRVAEAIGPAVVTVVDPGDAKLASQLGAIAASVTPDPSAV